MAKNRDLEIFKKINFSGVIPSPADGRDFTSKVAQAATPQEFPEEYLAPLTGILNQGVYSSCVAHSSASALMSYEKARTDSYNNYSRGYIYANRKSTDYQGEGMYIRQALKQLNKCGDVLHDDFPYTGNYKFLKDLIETKGQSELAQLAAQHKLANYFRCYGTDEIKGIIMRNGGVIICVPVYSSFARDIKKPAKTDTLSGYHAMLIVGWTKDYWIVQNSWGKTWGYNGLAHMDFDYPVSEYWGITFDQTTPEEKKSLFRLIIEFIIRLFKRR